MTILPAGTFRVSDYRKPIPERVKRAAIAWTARNIAVQTGDVEKDLQDFAREIEGGSIQFDHRPALENRPYDTEARDFIPPQHDPSKIDAIPADRHKGRTSGAVGQPYRGDVPMRARSRNIANAEEDRREARAAKVGQKHERRTDIPPPTKESQKAKVQIHNRKGWGNIKRKIAKRPKKEKPRKPPVGRFS